MTTMKTLESIQKFLQDNVCSNIKLKKPNDKNVDEFELVNPNVFIMNFPPKGHLPKGIESTIPCLIVTFEDGTDDNKTAEIGIRVIFIVYSPGFHQPSKDDLNYIECIPDGDGWRDLINFIDTAKATIQRNQILSGVTVQYPIKWGVYQKEEQTPELDPYFYGWITFSVSNQSYPAAEIEKLLL